MVLLRLGLTKTYFDFAIVNHKITINRLDDVVYVLGVDSLHSLFLMIPINKLVSLYINHTIYPVAWRFG